MGTWAESGDVKLRELQGMYEPYLNGLSQLLCMPLPGWGVGADFAGQPRSRVWARVATEPIDGPERPLHDDDANHL